MFHSFQFVDEKFHSQLRSAPPGNIVSERDEIHLSKIFIFDRLDGGVSNFILTLSRNSMKYCDA